VLAASRALAENASGKAQVMLAQGSVRPGAIWLEEYNVLLENPDVTSFTYRSKSNCSGVFAESAATYGFLDLIAVDQSITGSRQGIQCTN
jgi:hypothetical protein